MSDLSALRAFCDRYTIAQLARDLEITPQSISCWLRAGAVPPRRVPAVARLTGIPPHALNSESHPR